MAKNPEQMTSSTEIGIIGKTPGNRMILWQVEFRGLEYTDEVLSQG
jgi:hypothetical protein